MFLPKLIFSILPCKKKPTTQHISPLFVTSGPEQSVFLLLSNLPVVKLNQHHWKPNEDSNYMYAPAGTWLLYGQSQHGCAKYWSISFCLFSWERKNKNPKGAQLTPTTDWLSKLISPVRRSVIRRFRRFADNNGWHFRCHTIQCHFHGVDIIFFFSLKTFYSTKQLSTREAEPFPVCWNAAEDLNKDKSGK